MFWQFLRRAPIATLRAAAGSLEAHRHCDSDASRPILSGSRDAPAQVQPLVPFGIAVRQRCRDTYTNDERAPSACGRVPFAEGVLGGLGSVVSNSHLPTSSQTHAHTQQCGRVVFKLIPQSTMAGGSAHRCGLSYLVGAPASLAAPGRTSTAAHETPTAPRRPMC